MKQVHELIKELREDRDLKQSDVAKILGIVQQTYSNYETGQCDLPVRHLITLSEYYHVSSDYLLGSTTYSGAPESLSGSYTGTMSVGEFLSDAMALELNSRYALEKYLGYLLEVQRKK